MSLEENKATARRLVEEGWANPDILDGIIADDIVMHPDEARGLEAYKQGYVASLAGFPDYSHALEDIVAEGDKVAVRWMFSGTHTGEWAGVPPTNKQVSLRGMTTFRFAGGKVQEQCNVWNAYWVAEQLGIIPSWEEAASKAQSKQG